MRTLEVWLAGKRIGAITESRRGARFAYDESVYGIMPGVPVLSMSMPVKHKPYGVAKTRSWFEGLLPEGERRDYLCKQVDLDPLDWVGLLAEIGWECAGAVQVFPEGASHAQGDAYVGVDSKMLAGLLADVALRQPVKTMATFRMSLGGYQDKLCVLMAALPQGEPVISAEAIYMAQDDAPSTHILKPEPARYPGLAESEAWAMTAASFSAQCAKVALLDFDAGPETLVVERYDRKRDSENGVIRLHQEDACQALGLPITAKYANEMKPKGDDPTYAGMAELLDRYCANPTAEKEQLLRQLTVNMALGNWDAHAKNTSFLYLDTGSPVVAPLYDVVPIAEVEPRTTLLSLRVNGSLDPDRLSGSALLAEATSWGMEPELACDVVRGCLDDLCNGIDAAAELYPKAAARHEDGARRRVARLRVMA